MSNKQLGQYFTRDIFLKEKVNEFINNNPITILEPSIGRGDLVEYIKTNNEQIEFDMYEIDRSIDFLDSINIDNIIFGDFLLQEIEKKYKTIIGNPPYIKKKGTNCYIEFIERCYNLLDNNGELIFIVPSDFLKLTSSRDIINIMIENGNFTHFYHPHNEKLFENASIDIIIFRYQKNIIIDNTTIYNEQELYIYNNDGMITFYPDIITEDTLKIKDLFDVYVGMVSGKDEIYKNNDLGNIELLNGIDKINKFIFIEEFPSTDELINNYLLEQKNNLLTRKIRKFNESNWYQWGAPRNLNIIKQYYGDECIYVYNLTRKKEIAFKGRIQYFGGQLLMLKPKNKNIDLNQIINYLNSENFYINFLYSGRFKIGHRQLLNSFIIL